MPWRVIQTGRDDGKSEQPSALAWEDREGNSRYYHLTFYAIVFDRQYAFYRHDSLSDEDQNEIARFFARFPDAREPVGLYPGMIVQMTAWVDGAWTLARWIRESRFETGAPLTERQIRALQTLQRDYIGMPDE